MHTELLQSIGAIADSEPLMKRLTRYAKKLVREKEDPTLLTKEEFFANVDEALEQARQGRVHRMQANESLDDFLKMLWNGDIF